MALPVRIQRGQSADPLTLARNDFDTMVAHLFGDGGSPLATLNTYGVDIREDNEHIYVDADLPGFNKEDVQIQLENGTLSIIAERRQETPSQSQPRQPAASAQVDQTAQQSAGQPQSRPPQPAREQQERSGSESGQYLLRERRIERVVRSFTLPPNVDEQNVQARLENGVLHIVLNKREDAKPRRVQIS
jgi:HSP20 family protein